METATGSIGQTRVGGSVGTVCCHRVVRVQGHAAPEHVGSGGFDSNVITPGTEFMDRLAQRLRFFAQERVNTRPGWRGLRVVLSDASVPGEGEHKIMAFVRKQRTQPGYDPNLRHVLHGLDADLIMLGLATHEAHFSVLREEVPAPSRKRGRESGGAEAVRRAAYIWRDGHGDAHGAPVPMKPLQFLHVSVLREYLRSEFRISQQAWSGFDFERAMDDFVFLCFFVGNDFLPHLPALEIREGALDLLLAIYKALLPTMGHITRDGEVDLGAARLVVEKIAMAERILLDHRAERDQRQREKAHRPNMGGADGAIQRHDPSASGAGAVAADTAAPVAAAMPSLLRPRQDVAASANKMAAAVLRAALGAHGEKEEDGGGGQERK